MKRHNATSITPRKKATAVIVIFALLIIWMSTSVPEREEFLVVYDFADGITEPAHLAPINVTNDLVPRSNLYLIDEVHLEGLIHFGAWIWISDSEGKVLVLKRGPHLVTCPNSYGLLGEHTLGRENPRQTWRRAITEELGASMLRHIKSVKLLQEVPLYYFRDYGAQNSNRIDRQLTYLWWIKMDRPGTLLPLKLDSEVSHHDWIEAETLQMWFDEAHDNIARSRSVGDRMCHDTIVTLWETVFKEVQRLNTTKTTN